MGNCKGCDLHKSRTQVVPGDYGPKKGVCFIGEGPGQEEDKKGRPFVGRSGQLLDKMLASIGLHRLDVSVLNIVKCRPPNNRTPLPLEMQTCGSLWLNRQLELLNPSLIVTLGSVPLRYFFPKKRITQVKGELLFLPKGIPVYPLFHPAFILRNGTAALEDYKTDFQNLQLILSVQGKKTNDETKTTSQKSLLDFIQ